MNIFYKIKEDIVAELETFNLLNAITYGDIDEVDLDKTSNYALGHYIVNNVRIAGKVLFVDFSIILMDIVDDTEDNTEDVINTMLAVAVRLEESLRRGALYDKLLQLDGDVTVELFVDRFKDKVAGVTASYNIKVPNTIGIC